jgi:uncharacterized protein YdeI (YjbR/CyaY-like superfamily)
MGTRDERVDAYIARAAEFAKPILAHLRETVHEASPDCRETMKWSMPHFDYKGMLCSMAAFKQHVGFGFWKGRLVLGDRAAASSAAGNFGRITAVSDLPPKRVLRGYIKKAMALNDEGVKGPVRRKGAPKPPPRAPADLAAALTRSARARKAFDAFSPSHRREYIEWIAEAKTEETRRRRLDTAVAWMAEGKSRHWKYAR